MVPAGNKAKSLSAVNHTTKKIIHQDNIDRLEETLSSKCLILNLTYFSQVLHCYLRSPESIRGY